MIGPDYKKHRGGIGAVLETYNSFFETFKFISTYKLSSANSSKVFYFFKQIIVLFGHLIKDKDIKLVHIHGSHGASFYRKFIIIIVAKYIFKKKLIYHSHSSDIHIIYQSSGLLQKSIIRALINMPDLIICLSPSWYQFFTTTFSPKQIVIVNNVVNKPRSINSTPPGAIVRFLFLGRIGDRKGIFDLLKILASNVDFYRDKLKLTIGGDGEIKRLELFIKENNLNTFVEYVGWVSDIEKHKLLLGTDVYILPSYNEGLPISVLEAMSYDIPIISTNVGGTPDVVENEVNGFIFEPGDNKALEDAINNLIINPEILIKLKKGSLKKMKAYLPPKVAKQLLVCYQLLLYA